MKFLKGLTQPDAHKGWMRATQNEKCGVPNVEKKPTFPPFLFASGGTFTFQSKPSYK